MSKQAPAVDRAVQMAGMPMKDLPPLAVEFARHLCSKHGMCGEVFITAYAVYAQCAEGLSCEDDLYKARPEDREWFAAHGVPIRSPHTGFQPEPEFITVSYQGPPPEANDGPEFHLTPDEHRRGVITQETARELLYWLEVLYKSHHEMSASAAECIIGIMEQAEKELRGETQT